MGILCDYARAGIFLCIKNNRLWANGQLLPEDVSLLTERRAEILSALNNEGPSPQLMKLSLDTARMLTAAYGNSDTVSTEAYISCSQALEHAISQQNWPAVRKACVKIVRVVHPVEDIWRMI